jgi:hypothetical protein
MNSRVFSLQIYLAPPCGDELATGTRLRSLRQSDQGKSTTNTGQITLAAVTLPITGV